MEQDEFPCAVMGVMGGESYCFNGCLCKRAVSVWSRYLMQQCDFTCSWWVVLQDRFSVFVVEAQEGKFSVMVVGRGTKKNLCARGGQCNRMNFMCL